MLWTIGVDAILRELRKRPSDQEDFITSFGAFVTDIVTGASHLRSFYSDFIARRISESGLYRGFRSVEHIPIALERDAELIWDVKYNGIRQPIFTYLDGNGDFEIDGWHRLIIAKQLGYREITAFRKENMAWVRAAGHRTKLTLLIAHPDDELILLWPFLQSATEIVACVSDEDNAERQAWTGRLPALRKVCSVLGTSCHCFGLNSGFYRMRREALERFAMELAAQLSGKIVATHNAWGEYGHPDHILCHQVARSSARMVLSTNICFQRDWLPVAGRTPDAGRLSFEKFSRDIDRWEALRSLYAEHIPWPEDIPVADICEVYAC